MQMDELLALRLTRTQSLPECARLLLGRAGETVLSLLCGVAVAVNGQTCLIKRGVPVQIKRKFARVLEESMAQDNATADLISRETSKFQEESRARGIN